LKVLTKFAFTIKPYVQSMGFIILFGIVILAQFFFRTPLTTLVSMVFVLLFVMVNLLTVSLTPRQKNFYYLVLGLYVLVAILEIVAWIA